MRKKITTTFITSVLVLFIFILELILYKEITFLDTSNLFFFPAGILLIIGLFSLTLRSGFFDLFYYSIQKASRKLRSKNSDDDEELSTSHLSEMAGDFHLFFIKSGCILMAISVISLIGYYLFE